MTDTLCTLSKTRFQAEEEQNAAFPRRLPLTKGSLTQNFAQGVLSTKRTPNVSQFAPLLLLVHYEITKNQLALNELFLNQGERR